METFASAPSAGDADRGRGCVPNPALQVQRWHRQSVGSSHWRHPHCHAHRVVLTMAINSHRLSQQGAMTKRMTAIEVASMAALSNDKTSVDTQNLAKIKIASVL